MKMKRDYQVHERLKIFFKVNKLLNNCVILHHIFSTTKEQTLDETEYGGFFVNVKNAKCMQIFKFKSSLKCVGT